MVWRSWGRGPALVLLHGGYGSWRHWLRNVFPLADARRVIAPDLPGLGESDLPPEPHHPDGVAAIVAAGIDTILGPGADYDLVGFSFGGMLSCHVAALHGARVRSLTLVGAGGFGTPRAPVELIKTTGLTGPQRLEAHRINLHRYMIADAGRIDELAVHLQDWNTAHARLKSRKLSGLGTLPEAIMRVQAPVNAIWGEQDAASWPDVDHRERMLRELRPDIDFRRIAAAGHWVAYEAPARFNEILAGMLERPKP